MLKISNVFESVLTGAPPKPEASCAGVPAQEAGHWTGKKEYRPMKKAEKAQAEEIVRLLGQEIPRGRTNKSLRKSLISVKNSVKNEIQVRTEAVFLPYKACMWDSLESVWKAADEDPDCDAYVVPIPYFDRNPDGSFREEHYEGDLYPDYVPVTRYDEYDFQNRRPDMIFIHNPYDDCNYLTGVPPLLRFKEPEKYNEKLFYILYFCLGEIDPDNKEAVAGMAHFCTLPGGLYADKTIVQSEAMRRIYVNVLTDFTRETAADRAYWEDKILGLGSPKIDRAVNTRREDVEVPKEWLPIIEKEDESSVVQLCQKAGVPVMIQDVEI